jgi:hypothetical protein
MKCRALRCGRYCEVLSPSEFRQLWQDEIAALAELAAQPGSTQPGSTKSGEGRFNQCSSKALARTKSSQFVLFITVYDDPG